MSDFELDQEAMKFAQQTTRLYQGLSQAVVVLKAAKAADKELSQLRANIRGLQKDHDECKQQTADAQELFQAERARQNDELVLYETKIEQAQDKAEKIVNDARREAGEFKKRTDEKATQVLAAAEQGAAERLAEQKAVEVEIEEAQERLRKLRSEIKRIASGAE